MARRGFVIHHNGPPANCVGRAHTRCQQFWDAVCRYHGEKFGAKWAPTSLYSFGMCPHGVRFEGRGWTQSQAANGRDVVGADDGGDAYWYTVLAFLGGDEKPTGEMVAGLADLIGEGRDSGRCGQRVLPHNRFKIKACPGPELTDQAYAWDNAPLNRLTPTPLPEEDDMHGTDIIASYIEAKYDITEPQIGKDIRSWNHAIYAKPTRQERDGGVAYIRALLGLPA